MLIRFLKSENSERLDSWSGGTEANLHVPRVGDIIKIVRRVAGAVEQKPYDAFFRVERVIWDGSNIVDVILRETVE